MATATPIMKPTFDTRRRPRMTARRVALPGPLPDGVTYPAELTDKLAALQRLTGDYAAARRALSDAEAGRLAAERADRQSFASALRADSAAVPHGNALSQVEASIATLTERIAALRMARDAAEAELVEWIEAHRSEATDALEPALDLARTARAKAVRLLDQADGRLDELLGIESWLRDPWHRPVAPPRSE